MGIDCKIFLPAKSRVRDVADVLAALHGCEVTKQTFSGTSGGWATNVEGVTVKGSDSVAECATILFKDRWFLYHFEFHNDGCRGLMPRSTASNIAAMKGLADFFGGRVDFDDCDDCECDYYVDEQPDISASDGNAWYRLQERKLSVKPMSKQQIAECEQFAAYKNVA